MQPRMERGSGSVLALLLALAPLGCAGPPAQEQEQEQEQEESTLPAGRLGHPIGTYLRIEGVRAEHGKVGNRSLLVERVGERSLSSPTEIWLDNLPLPKDTRCVLRGYETGRWIGVPPEVEAAGALEPQQALWQFWRYFIVTSVEEPPALVEQFRERGR